MISETLLKIVLDFRKVFRGPTKKKPRYIVTHYRGKKAIIVAHDRNSHPEKNYNRKNGTYRWSSLSRKKR